MNYIKEISRKGTYVELLQALIIVGIPVLYLIIQLETSIEFSKETHIKMMIIITLVIIIIYKFSEIVVKGGQ